MNSKKEKINLGLALAGWFPVTYDEATGVITRGAIQAFAGARQLNLTKKGDSFTVYAVFSDGNYKKSMSTNDGYDISIELTGSDDDFKHYALNEQIDANGNYVERSADAELPRFGMVWRWKNLPVDIYHVVYFCTASRPDLSSTVVKDGGSNQNYTETVNITCDSDPVLGIVKMRTGDNTLASVKSAWFSTVQLPSDVVSHKLTVTVSDANGVVSGAYVILNTGETGVSGSDGVVSFNLAAGSYVIAAVNGTASADGTVTMASADQSLALTLA